MLELPDQIWIARREYERPNGIECVVEAIVTIESLLDSYRQYDYEITRYVRADA